METMLLSALMAGLLGSLHCAGMCGGIASALGMSLKKTSISSQAIYPGLFFQLGRISSYFVAGFIAGSLGDVLTQSELINNLATYLRLFSALFIIGLGFYLAGLFPFFSLIEKLGLPVWKKISPLSKYLLPVKHLPQAYGLGFLWGWLPCGLTYSILLWSVAAGSGIEGGLLMLVFGLGTIPAMLPITLGGGQILKFIQHPILRKVVGLVIVLGGIYILQHSISMLGAADSNGVDHSKMHH